MGWTDYLASQSFNIRSQIPTKLSFWDRFNEGLAKLKKSEIAGLALRAANPYLGQFSYAKQLLTGKRPTLQSEATDQAALLAAGATILGGKAAVSAAQEYGPRIVEQLKGGGLATAAKRTAVREAKAYVRKRARRQRKSARRATGKRRAPAERAPRAKAKSQGKRVKKPPTAKQLAARRKFAEMVRARARARKGG